ncbi:MAG: alpha/beta hydrolase [Clostridia bacterium]|nr:alpha/beta hydrolase [Clostridia bacterium]
MKFYWIILICLLAVLLLVLAGAFVCFYIPFYVKRPKKAPEEHKFDIPKGEVYEPFREKMIAWMKETYATPCREFFIKSHDGLTLHGVYYEKVPGAPIELMFHGYRGTAERDLCGGMQRCFSLGRNAFIVDQRTSGKSEGHVISFGLNESRDCLAWVDFMIKTFGPDVKIILCGISMGAATVSIASGYDLPENVVGVLADCGYTTAKDIIKTVMKKIGVPPDLLYPLVRLGAMIFGHFDPDKVSPRDSVANSKVPVIFIHGGDDDFVPPEMSVQNHAACSSEKAILTVPGAGHGLSYLVDPEAYLNALEDFFPIYTSRQ